MAIGRIPEPGTGIPESIVDAKGDLVTATAADTPARLAVGTNEHRLVAASGETTGLKYVADTTNYAIAAKGDLLVGTAADTLQALSVGTNGHTLVADSSTATGLKWAAAAAGGKVLQVVHADTTTDTTVASTTPTDTTLSATITPSSATSKVLVIVAQNAGVQSASQNSYSQMRLMRGATEIWASGTEMLTSDGGTTGGGSNNVVTMQSIVYLDSPSTTSATTYKTQGYVNSTANSNAFRAQRTSSRSNIILMEIGA